MGQKVSPNGLRLGINKPWKSSWAVKDKKDIAKNILEDNNIRTFIKKNYFSCGISSINIERTSDSVTIEIATGRPGVIIGAKGAGIEKLKKELAEISSAKNTNINIKEVKNLDLDAQLVGEGIAAQLEKRAQFRRVMKQTAQRVMRAGADGVKIMVSGRLDGAEIARSEKIAEGSLPLHTLRANIDYALSEAHTIFGVIGVKVWIYKGDIIGKINIAEHNKGGK